MYHYRKTRNTYERHNHADQVLPECTFCKASTQQRAIQETDTMFIIANRVPYDTFEGKRVLEHLMVVPKQHHESLADLSDQEKLEMMTLLGEYETRGFNVYARGVGSSTRSVTHQHTHLLRLASRQKSFMLYAKKPYILLEF